LEALSLFMGFLDLKRVEAIGLGGMAQAMAQAAGEGRSLVDQIDRVLIIAYRETTELLEAAFAQAGFECEVLRQVDQLEYEGYAAIYRCLLNHQRAWERAAGTVKPMLIVEADFVPVVNLGRLPLPFAIQQPDVGMAWLYTCASQLYSVTPEGFAEGFSTGLVAYVLTPQGARGLQDFVAQITAAQGTGYYNFDSEIDRFLRQQGFKNYIPFRNYGEHGGKANPEHRRNGMSGIHRADVLFDRLAFLPDYAMGDRGQFWQARARARLKGLGRSLLGKYLRPKIAVSSSVPSRLICFALLRQLTPHL
jgi:hypothetical protein